ncbi:PIN domain-containing protein [Candidatus Woesearchaeota archaeon]|nr:PIN domain-containing protein [Candidatus Woesearchaeota archaeon]
MNLNQEHAEKIWLDVTEGKSRLVVPTIIITELTKAFLRKNLGRELQEFLSSIEKSQKISIVDLTPSIASQAGKFSNTFNMPTVDSVILATAISTEYDNILTNDPHFNLPARQNKIKMIRF